MKPTANFRQAAKQANPKEGFGYWIPIFMLIGLVLGSALALAYQVFLYRETFQTLQKAHQERNRLDNEWGRLLIEQQTFGAITQIGGRAVMALRMYSPPAHQTVTIRVGDESHDPAPQMEPKP